MLTVDTVIVLILLWGAWRGWKAGLIKEAFSTCGLIVGLIVAVLFYKVLGEYFSPALGSGSLASYAGCVMAFVLIWVLVPIFAGIGANVLTKAVKNVFLGPLNSFLGMLLGALKFLILISFVFSAMSYVGIISDQKKNSSRLYPYVTVVGNMVLGKGSIAQESDKNKDKTVIIKFDRSHKDKNDAAKRGK